MYNFTLYCNQATPATVIVTPDKRNISSDTITYSNKAPVNWNSMNYSFLRDEKFIGLVTKFTDDLGWEAEAKQWIDDIYKNIGINAEITIYVTTFDKTQRKFVYLFDGILNLSTLIRKQYRSTCNIEDGIFFQLFRNRNGIEYDIQSILSQVYTTSEPSGISITPPIAYDLVVNAATTATIKAYKPYDLFSQLIAIMTGSQVSFKSPLFESGGELEYKMITTGKFIRGFDESHTTLSISFNTLFTFFKNAFCLGLSIEKDDTGIYYVYIDKYERFFNRVVVHEITNPSNLQFLPDTKYIFNEINCGYSNYEKTTNNTTGNREYNKKIIYSTPINPILSKLDLTLPIRGDGTAIQLLLDNAISSQDDLSENNLDNEIFFIDSYIKDGVLTSRGIERFESIIDDSTGAKPYIILNAENTPARILKRWGPIVRAGLQNNNQQYLKVNKIDILSNINSRLISETNNTIEGEDILISTLDEPYISGEIARFDFTMEVEDILAIKANPNGLIKVFDYINKKYIYGWIRDLPSKPIDKTTNAELIIASDFVVSSALKSKIKLLSGAYLRQLSDGYIYLTNQN